MSEVPPKWCEALEWGGDGQDQFEVTLPMQLTIQAVGTRELTNACKI